MQTTNTTQKYSLSLRVLHWLTALTIMSLLTIGFYMSNLDPDAADKYALYPLHKAFGMIALLLVMLRLPTRAKGPIPDPASGLKLWESRLSQQVHIALYVAMLAMTWSGYFMNSTYAHASGIDMFGLFNIPDITEKTEYWNAICHQIHSVTAWSFIVLLTLHLAGVAKHRWFDGKEQNVLPRMI